MNLANITFLASILTFASIAMAGDVRPFNQQEFEKLSTEGKSVVLDVSATWCPTCRAQKPIIDSLMKQSSYKDVTVLTLDFDTSKPILRKFKVSSQSTLVAFKGTQEVGRSVGDTSPEGIESLIKKTIN